MPEIKQRSPKTKKNNPISAPIVEDHSWLHSLNGFLLVDKDAGMTSQDVITRMQRMLIARSSPTPSAPPTLRKRELPKMGHGGTLDPFATGLLVIAVGDGTKLARYLLDSAKEYEADVTFGARTASGDLTNEVVERTENLPLSSEALKAAALTLMGSYVQLPPMYSAKKIDGTPLYELARKGLEVKRATVNCMVSRADILSVEISKEPGSEGISHAKIAARVSSGTYIRTLAEDLAKRAGSLAHLRTLRRLSTGPADAKLSVDRAVTLGTLNGTQDWTKLTAFIPFDDCLRGKIPELAITSDESKTILHGLKNVIEGIAPRLNAFPESPRVALYDGSSLRAVFIRTDSPSGWDFERVFSP